MTMKKYSRRSWSREQCINALHVYLKQRQQLPTTHDMNAENGLPTPTKFKETVGHTPAAYLYFEEPELFAQYGKRSYWSEETILSALDQFVEENERIPLYIEMNYRFNLPDRNTVKRMVGVTYQELCESRYPQYYARSQIEEHSPEQNEPLLELQ